MKEKIMKKGCCVAIILFLVGICAIPSISGENLEKSYSITGGTNPAPQNANGVTCGYEEIIIGNDHGSVGIHRKTPGGALLKYGFFDGEYYNSNLFTSGTPHATTLDYIFTSDPYYPYDIRLYSWDGNPVWVQKLGDVYHDDKLSCGDVDGDTFDEFILGRPDDCIFVYEVTSTGLWESNKFNLESGYTRLIGCGDFDGDGTDEIVINKYNNFKLKNKDGTGNTVIIGEFNWDACAIGDVDADGNDELIIIKNKKITYYNDKSQPENTFEINYDLSGNFEVCCGKFEWNFKESIVISDYANNKIIFADDEGDQYYIDYDFEYGDSVRCGDFVIDYPKMPEEISGLNNIIPNLKVKYSTKAYTPNRYDKLWYSFDWDDGEATGWIGPYKSGEEVVASHAWKKPGYYTIRVWVENFYYMFPYCVKKIINCMKSRQTINTPILNFLQNHPNLFPILRRVLQRLNL